MLEKMGDDISSKEKKSNVVYISLPVERDDADLEHKWFMINPNLQNHLTDFRYDQCDTFMGIKEVSGMARDVIPTELRNVQHYGCTAYDGKIYIVGGVNLGSGCHSNYAFIYDIESENWETHPCMFNSGGRTKPALVAFRNKLYIFGSSPKESWAECYDLEDNTSKTARWEWEPVPSPLSPRFDKAEVHYHVSYQYGNKVLLWVVKLGDNPVVYSYDFLEQTWNDLSESINTLPYTLGERMVVVGDMLFCQYFKTLYGYHLTRKQTVIQKPLDERFDNYTARCYLVESDMDQVYLSYEFRCCLEELNLNKFDVPKGFLLHPQNDTLLVIGTSTHFPRNEIMCYKIIIGETSSGKEDEGTVPIKKKKTEDEGTGYNLKFGGYTFFQTGTRAVENAVAV